MLDDFGVVLLPNRYFLSKVLLPQFVNKSIKIELDQSKRSPLVYYASRERCYVAATVHLGQIDQLFICYGQENETEH